MLGLCRKSVDLAMNKTPNNTTRPAACWLALAEWSETWRGRRVIGGRDA